MHPQVFLETALVNVLDNKKLEQLAPYYNRSQSCFITSKCCKEFRFKKLTWIPVYGLNQYSKQTRSSAKINLQSQVSSYKINLDCLIIDKITQVYLLRMNLKNLQMPRSINFDRFAIWSTVKYWFVSGEVFFYLNNVK